MFIDSILILFMVLFHLRHIFLHCVCMSGYVGDFDRWKKTFKAAHFGLGVEVIPPLITSLLT